MELGCTDLTDRAHHDGIGLYWLDWQSSSWWNWAVLTWLTELMMELGCTDLTDRAHHDGIGLYWLDWQSSSWWNWAVLTWLTELIMMEVLSPVTNWQLIELIMVESGCADLIDNFWSTFRAHMYVCFQALWNRSCILLGFTCISLLSSLWWIMIS